MIQIPQLAWPIRLNAAGTDYQHIEQDSPEEHRQSVALVFATPLGSLIDNPPFGTPEQAFRRGGADPEELLGVIEKWEPRTRTSVGPADIVDIAEQVQVQVTGNG